jgi:OOP family OmpA-OmpF porin
MRKIGVVARWGVVFAALAGSVLGCSASAEVAVKTADEPAVTADKDGDGIADKGDKCPSEKEDGLAPQAKDGCPTDDADKDGIAGKADSCPDKPETVNKFKDDDGCPDEAPKPAPRRRARLTADKVVIDQAIKFKTDSAEIEAESEPILKDVLGVMKENPDIDFVEVAGHADKRGGDAKNKELTQKRADAVMAALEKDGIDKNRMRAVGYGSYCPEDPAETDEAYTKNRRVEFVVLRRAGAPLAAKWGGCPEAAKKGMKIAAIPDTAPKSKAKAVPVARAKREKGKVTREGSVLTLPDNVNFVTDKWDLGPGAEDIVKLLRDYLNANKDITKLRIEGHAAQTKNSPSLESLSRNRAKTVVEWLVKNGIDKKRLFAVGCGAKRLLMGKDGKPDMEESKRTEAHVVETNGVLEPDQPIVPADCEVVQD